MQQSLAKKLIVGLITGQMSFGGFYPPVFKGAHNAVSDPAMCKWELRYIKYLVGRMKKQSAIVGWDLGNEVEHIAAERLLDMLPEPLRACYEPLVHESDPDITPIVKAADKLSAYIKCIEEQKAGNTEFDSAAKQSMEAMQKMDMPELQWFIDNCLEPFSLNIDQL